MVTSKQINLGGAPDKYSTAKDFESWKGGNIAKQPQLYGTEMLGDINLFSSDHLCFSEDSTAEEEYMLCKYQQQEVQLFPHFGLDDLYLDVVSPPFQFSQEEITKLASIKTERELIKPQKAKPDTFPLASLGILKNYRSRFRQFTSTTASGQKLSTDAIIRLAREKFIQSFSQRLDDLSLLSHQFVCSFTAFSDEELRDVELICYVLASAEKVGQQQFDIASKLVNQCDDLSSNKGNPVQRLVYYFSEALREKISRETARITSKGLRNTRLYNIEEALMCASPSLVSFQQKVPLTPANQFAGVQAIVDSVSEAKRVHIIDIEIRNGSQGTVLMQALADRRECPLEHLKITAVGTRSKLKIEETGKQLMSFAQSINLPFSFNVVMAEDVLDLHEDLFKLDVDETVAVYSPHLLSSMIAQPDRLECLMSVIKNTNPCVFVVSEVEANHNSPVFVNRFIEALFTYSAFFDSVEDCMDRDDPNRMSLESIYFNQVIRNIVAFEGGERTIRHVNIDVWRAFFAKFGMVERELSTSSLYQASFVVNKFACRSSCTLDMNRNCLLVGWKGRPIFSVSTWKFHSEEER